MNKLFAFFSVFRAGSAVSDPAAWKRGDITVAMISGLVGSIIVLAKVFDYDIPLTEEQINYIAGAILAVCGLFIHPAVTVASTEKLGVGVQPNNQITPEGPQSLP